jgi:taurine dioxygenase
MVNSNIVENGKPVGLADGGQHWHTDGAYLEAPYRTTILYAVEVPVNDEGVALGDTAFASTSAAYDALPEDTKQRLEGMRAIHCHGVAREKYKPALDKSQSEALRKTVEHPVVRTHPVTGRKCLYVNPGSTLRLAGMEEKESESLLASLCERAVRPELRYRHNWRVGDVVMWDNCSTQHCAIADYEPRRRLLYRTIVQGERPV